MVLIDHESAFWQSLLFGIEVFVRLPNNFVAEKIISHYLQYLSHLIQSKHIKTLIKKQIFTI
jgi:hypothetical protein